MLDQDFEGRFATAILAHLRFTRAGVELRVAAAGHPAALVTRADGEVGELGGSGTLLGVFPDAAIEEVVTTLEPGDSLALYTDGLSEAHAPHRIVTVEEMIARLALMPARSAQNAIDSLLGLIDLEHRVCGRHRDPRRPHRRRRAHPAGPRAGRALHVALGAALDG